MNLIRRFIYFYWQFREYNQLLGFRESLLFIWFEFLKREKIKVIRVGDTKIHVRTNSPDLRVTIRTLFKSEFDEIDSNNPSIIIDAGAYIGTSAIFFSKKYPMSKVYAIEPEDGNFDMMKRNIAPFNNVIPIKAALWSSHEIRPIKNRFTGHYGYTITDTLNKNSSTGQQIKCVSLTDIMKTYNIDIINILKMDIEGSEKKVLEMSEEWIEKIDIITVELHDDIVDGCDRAFYLATKDFIKFKKNGEKITAYRK